MPTLSFIGAGNMAEAIARGILHARLYAPSDLSASDPNPDRQKLFTSLGIPCTPSLTLPAQADILILATKPAVIPEALAQLKAAGLRQDALLISIAAGISAKFIEHAIGGGGENGGGRVIRVMPNTPMLAGKGMSALAPGSFSTDADLSLAEQIFAAAGKTLRLPESSIDAVTALSGSGPAYLFYLAETLTHAGTAAGLTPEQAALLARQTLIGAAALLDQSPDSPEELRRKVTTPNGTTHAAIETLKAGNLQSLVTRAVQAAKSRSQELGK